jgi:hypothetical protein
MNYKPIRKSTQRVIPYGMPVYNSDMDDFEINKLGEKIYTFATLPTPSLNLRVRISDSNQSVVGGIISGSGTQRGFAQWNGANWLFN